MLVAFCKKDQFDASIFRAWFVSNFNGSTVARYTNKPWVGAKVGKPNS